MFRMQTVCPHCKGRGTVVTEKCTDCRGNGRVSVKRKLTVKVPAGIQDGQAIRVQGEGEPPPPEVNAAGQGIRGDLHVVVRIQDHERFEREGDDLLLASPIGFTQLALGGELEVSTIDGTRTLTVPPGTQHGALFRVDGAGLPNLRTGKRGDLVVIAQLVVPRKITDAQRKLLMELAKIDDVAVNAQSESAWEKIKRKVKGT